MQSGSGGNGGSGGTHDGGDNRGGVFGAGHAGRGRQRHYERGRGEYRLATKCKSLTVSSADRVRTEHFASPESAAEYAAQFCTNRGHMGADGKHAYAYGFAGAAIMFIPPTAAVHATPPEETEELRAGRYTECAHLMMIVNERGRLALPGGTPERKDCATGVCTSKTSGESKGKIIPNLECSGAPTAEREVAEEVGCVLSLSRDRTYVCSQVQLFPAGRKPGDYTCHIGHLHSHLVATRDAFDVCLRQFDARKTDEVLAVIGMPLFHTVSAATSEHKRPKTFGLSNILGREGGIAAPLAGETSNPTRGHDILLLAYLHGVLDVRQLLQIGKAADSPGLDALVSQLARFNGMRASIARRIAMMSVKPNVPPRSSPSPPISHSVAPSPSPTLPPISAVPSPEAIQLATKVFETPPTST